MLLEITACSQHELFDSPVVEQPKIGQVTQSARRLAALPPARIPTVVSVYEFQDQSGQLKPNLNFAEYSRAVTQGGLAILNKALLSAGNGSWFTVAERGGLRNLLQERQIVSTMRAQYATPDGTQLGKLPPLLYAGMLIEGGIVGYDSNIVTGGAGANYLGIGGNIQHQRDIVTVDLRAISVANGQVILSVTSEKTIYSTGIQGNIFKYVSLDHLLEAESGFTMNEPPQLAVRQAIETAVYELIMEGVRRGLWQFADQKAGQAVLADYLGRLEAAQSWTDMPSTTAASAPSASALINTQLPAASEPASVNPQAEKQSIIGDEKTTPAPANQLPDYPPIPLAPLKGRQ